jgi:hypothetical protein
MRPLRNCNGAERQESTQPQVSAYPKASLALVKPETWRILRVIYGELELLSSLGAGLGEAGRQFAAFLTYAALDPVEG